MRNVKFPLLVVLADNEGDKDAAGIYAKTVSNVFSVDNNLAVSRAK